MALMEREIKELEEQIPQLAGEATANAFRRALASGDTVVIAQQGKIYQINPDGSRSELEVLKALTRKSQGRFLTIR